MASEEKRVKKRRLIQNFCVIKGLIFLLFTSPSICDAAGARPGYDAISQEPGWSFPLRGAYTHQFDTDIDNNGGKFSVDRFFIQGGATYATRNRLSFTLSLGYDFNGYDFSGEMGFAGLRPWKDIHSLRIGTPISWGLDENWTLLVIPSLRFTAESGADLGDGVQGGGFVGASYRVSDRLTIGPGIGVITQIEDNASVFPVLLINWRITDSLSLETGRGLGATLGPGLFLKWEATDKWHLSLGGRYEKLRFRLDKDGVAPDGVGEDRSFPILAGVTYRFTRQIQASLIGGVELGGKLKLDDENGNEISEEGYDAAGFAGVTFRFRF
jgi:hypothetical protein